MVCLLSSQGVAATVTKNWLPLVFGSAIRHGKQAGLGVLQRRVELIGKLIAGSAASGAFRIAALDHEVGNDAMENRAVEERLAGLGSVRQADEVLHRARGLIGVQFGFERPLGGIEDRIRFHWA